jgi:hypothetical protein
MIEHLVARVKELEHSHSKQDVENEKMELVEEQHRNLQLVRFAVSKCRVPFDQVQQSDKHCRNMHNCKSF